jgi:VIT1/CCC1 family predicted Fe2+/Mn2+ transporter
MEKHPHNSPITRMLIMGISDGVIGMLVLITSLSALRGTPELIVTTGLAYILSGGVSMAITTYVFLVSEKQTLKADIAREAFEIETEPDEEKEELMTIFKQEGYSDETAKKILDTVTRDKDTWLKAQLKFELNKTIDRGGVTAKQDITGVVVGFVISSLMLLPFVFEAGYSTAVAVVIGTSILFATTATNLSPRLSDLDHGVKVTIVVLALIIGLYLAVHLTGIQFS